MAPSEKDMDAPLADDTVLAAQTQAAAREYTVVYPAVATMLFWHLGGLYGMYLCLTSAMWATIIFNAILYMCAMLGITAGAHRLWSHRSYKATLPLQVLLMLFQSLAYQHSALRFARDHRYIPHRAYRVTLPLQVLLMLFQSLAYQHSALRFTRDHRYIPHCAYWATLPLQVLLMLFQSLPYQHLALRFARDHRYIPHGAYRATLPLQVLLVLFQSLAYQHSALRFARDHRYIPHGAYRATLPLQVLLVLFQSLAYQHSALRFARDHRYIPHRAYRATLPLQVLLMLFQSLPYQHSAVRFARDHMYIHHGTYRATLPLQVLFMLFQSLPYQHSAVRFARDHMYIPHGTYRATLPLQVLFMLFQSLAYQHSALRFARDHRAHHKFSDTDADPYNPARGFFFAHIGWLMVRKHPQAVRRGRAVHVADLYQNPVLLFQNKYSFYLTSLLAFVLPALIPWYCWQEALSTAHHVSALRVLAVWHAFFTTNSAAHQYGNRPYDKRIMPTQNLPVTFITLGEGFHNFHHVFPFDYRAAERGNNSINLTTKFIDLFAWMGWAYDLKHASPEVVAKRASRTGDGTDLWGNRERYCYQ